MMQRFGGMFGGVLSLVLGIVLITGGALSGTDGAAGTPTPTCVVQVGGQVACPTGTITINEQAAASAQQQAARSLAAAKPTSWTVLVTSTNCSAPNGLPVNQTLTVPTGGSATTDPLFVYTDPGHATSCGYQLAVTPAAGYTSKFSPAPPITIPFTANRATGNSVTVQLINTAIVVTSPPTTTSTSPTSPRTSSTAPTQSSSSAAESSSASASDAASSASSSAAPLAATGPTTPAAWTLVLGIALCLLGAVLIYAGRPNRFRARHAQ